MKKYLISKLETLNSDQKGLYDDMQSNDKLQICIPTGAGKGYVLMIDLLNQIVSTKNKIFAIASHRLMLNNQHLNDIFSEILSPSIGKIGYIFVGSSRIDISKLMTPEFNTTLFKKKIGFHELVSSTTSTKEIDSLVKMHKDADRKVVIFTTYHSMNKLKNISVDTLYCDEAHTLASADESKFKENFEKVKYKRCFFLTATPKDCFDKDTDSFLMNNEEIFGKRIGLNFKHCVEAGYIVKPVIHIAVPDNISYDMDYKSTPNMVKFIKDTYLAHSEFIKKNSFDPERIAPKILVKCPSVDEMWKIHKELVGKIPGIKICAGASKNDNSVMNHFIDLEGISDRSEYLEKVQNLPENMGAIVLHYDTMSEGINVAGFTGTEFLAGKLPTLSKILQNTGRSTRLHKFDRDRLWNGEINTSDYSKWIKPYCAVIIPYWDRESEITTRDLAKQIRSLRDEFGYDPTYQISIGSDIGRGEFAEDIDKLNDDQDKRKKFEIIQSINNNIEELDNEEIELNEKTRINSLSKLELLKEVFGNQK